VITNLNKDFFSLETGVIKEFIYPIVIDYDKKFMQRSITVLILKPIVAFEYCTWAIQIGKKAKVNLAHCFDTFCNHSLEFIFQFK
jgi:hypothetical protein